MTGRRSHGRLSALNGVVHQGTDITRLRPARPGSVPASSPRGMILSRLRGIAYSHMRLRQGQRLVRDASSRREI